MVNEKYWFDLWNCFFSLSEIINCSAIWLVSAFASPASSTLAVKMEAYMPRNLGSTNKNANIHLRGRDSFSSPEPLGLICNDVTKKRRALGTRMGRDSENE